jgi:nucleoside-diphosphate-sugar epimerase
MVMPDAIKSLITLEEADQENLSQFVYNVTSFNPTAQEIYEITTKAFPGARISFDVDQRRQKIVDSWPEDVDDSAARRDWGCSRITTRSAPSGIPDPCHPQAVRRACNP